MDIQPDKQNLDQTFSTTVFYIDFYQRDYKWTDEPVRRLLDDVFYQFEESYAKHAALEPNKENINARYPWYYLNTYVTNTVGGRVFVVDGQQRLTTLTLILIKLHQMAKAIGSKTAGWLERKIAGYSGTEHEFWMNHVRHIHVLQRLMEGQSPRSIDTTTGVTATNMVKNFELISSEFETRLPDIHRFDTFVHYFLFRLVLINLSVDATHVPMVFEVINDRGVRLKPYEILKGKLLGQIDKVELDGDEERFEQERNRLGGILLLKGKDNISSNNEVYAEKLKTYANTLYWNETLRADAYQSKLDFRSFAKEHNLKFHPLDQFGPNELEERQHLLFDIAAIIWNA